MQYKLTHAVTDILIEVFIGSADQPSAFYSRGRVTVLVLTSKYTTAVPVESGVHQQALSCSSQAKTLQWAPSLVGIFGGAAVTLADVSVTGQ